MRYLSLIVLVVFISCCVNATVSPQYSVLLAARDVEIRLYHESSWISAPVMGGTSSFNKSTHDGFHRLYQYIHGANEDNTMLQIAKPILTTITSTPNGLDYLVNMYLPSKPPMPSPQLNLHISNWKSRCIAIRTFPGFAQDDNIYKERSSLSFSLAKGFNGKNISVSEDKSSYSIAQYNSSSHNSGRVNEVWVNVLTCPSVH
ncbi:heme-binding protein 2-like protein [Tanacetum coccineum]